MDKNSRILADKYQKKILSEAGQMNIFPSHRINEGNGEVVLVKNIMDGSSTLINNEETFLASQNNDIDLSK